LPREALQFLQKLKEGPDMNESTDVLSGIAGPHFEVKEIVDEHGNAGWNIFRKLPDRAIIGFELKPVIKINKDFDGIEVFDKHEDVALLTRELIVKIHIRFGVLMRDPAQR
jgi:hypothetical protein